MSPRTKRTDARLLHSLTVCEFRLSQNRREPDANFAQKVRFKTRTRAACVLLNCTVLLFDDRRHRDRVVRRGLAVIAVARSNPDTMHEYAPSPPSHITIVRLRR